MAKHTRTYDFTPDQEAAWEAVLVLTNAGLPADAQLPDVDALLDQRMAELTAGAEAYVKAPIKARVSAKIDTGTLAEVDAIDVAAGTKPVPKPEPADPIAADPLDAPL